MTFSEPNIALCQRERQPKRQAGEAVIQSEVLRISPGSSSFSNYPPGGILAVLDNNGSPGCAPVTSQVWVEEANERSGEMFALLLCHLKSTTAKQTGIISCTTALNSALISPIFFFCFFFFLPNIRHTSRNLFRRL